MSFELAKCPMCDAVLTYPDAPTYDLRGPDAKGHMRRVVVNIACPKCPATTTVFADTGHVCCFTPNQPLKVHVSRR